MRATDDRPSPPYLAFSTLRSFIERLGEKPLPPRIDRSMMDGISGGNQAYLFGALKFFGLLTSNHEVTDRLTRLVTADENERKSTYGQLIRERYPMQLDVSAQQGTEAQLYESFAQWFDNRETRRKAVTFFLHAATHAGIALSPHFPSVRSGSGAPGTPKKRRTRPRTAVPLGPPAGAVAREAGKSHTVDLDGAGTITLTIDLNLFALDRDRRDSVLALVDQLKQLEGQRGES